MQAGGPLMEEVLEKSSSDGLVKEVLIWLHRALILLSPSPGTPISISGTSKKGRDSMGRGGEVGGNCEKEGEEDSENKGKSKRKRKNGGLGE